MKATFKFALLCAATLAMVACEPNTDKPKHDDDEEEEAGFVSMISVTDKSTADWDNVPAEYLAEAKHEGSTQWDKLKSLKVYADEMYINILAEYDAEFYQDPTRLTYKDGAGEVQEYYSGLHIYLDADNSDKTGGYGDEFADANAEINLECGFLSAGKHINWDPAYFKWWGEVGADGWEWTDPSVEHDGSDYWGAIIGTGMGAIANSQQPAPGIVEIQILRESLESAGVVFAETFGLGMDIQFDWESIGVLPNAPDDAVGSAVKAPKLKVTIDRTEK